MGTAVWTQRQARSARRAPRRLRRNRPRSSREVLDRVRREYVDPIDDRQLVASAIRGILKDLDQHSTYLDPSQYEDIRISTSGNYTGVGLDVAVDAGKVTVVAPLDGAPAARAGILTRRRRRFSGQRSGRWSERRGDRQSNARRSGHRGHARRDAQRQQHAATVRVDAHGGAGPNGLAASTSATASRYMRLSSFAESTPRDLLRAAEELRTAANGNLLGVVLDLRNNPGGVLDAAVQVADAFIADGLIVRGTAACGRRGSSNTRTGAIRSRTCR